MYDMPVALAKFEELIELAERAESRFENAVVFTATVTLSDRFVGEEGWRPGLIDVNPSFLTAVEEVRRNICAYVGYDHGDAGARMHLERATVLVTEMKRVMHECGHMPTRSFRPNTRITASKGYFRAPGRKPEATVGTGPRSPRFDASTA